MARLGNRQKETVKAIKDLIGLFDPTEAGVEAELAEVKTLSDIPEALRDEFVLDHGAIRTLFKAVPKHRYVSGYVAAAYLDRSLHTIQVHLRAAHGLAWKAALEALKPPALKHDRLFRWGFVLEMAEALEVRQKVVRSERRRHKASALYEAVVNRFQVVQDRDKNIVGVLGQGGMTADEIIDAINAGGSFALMTITEALARPWTIAQRRGPWQAAMLAWLSSVGTAIAEGEAHTQARQYDLATGAPTHAAPDRL